MGDGSMVVRDDGDRIGLTVFRCLGSAKLFGGFIMVMFCYLSLLVEDDPAISGDRSDMFISLVIRFFFMVFLCCASLNRRSTKRIQVFGFYRFMEAAKDTGREAAYCDKPVNRLA